MIRATETVLIIVLVMLTIGLVAASHEKVVTLDVTAPDGQQMKVKGILGGDPITLTDQSGATWTIQVKEIETR